MYTVVKRCISISERSFKILNLSQTPILVFPTQGTQGIWNLSLGYAKETRYLEISWSVNTYIIFFNVRVRFLGFCGGGGWSEGVSFK